MGKPTEQYNADVFKHFVTDVMGGMPQCAACTRQNQAKPHTCEAYPDGIPLKIIGNEVDHHDPYEGDQGLQFQAKPPNAR